MPENRYDAIVAGHVCLDIIPELSHPGGSVEKVFVPGKLLNIESTAFCTGGAVSNVGIPLIKLGISTGLMGKIGNDAFGSGIRSIFAKYRAEQALTMVEGEHSSYTVVMAPRGIDRIFLHHPGANDTFCSADINYDLVRAARLFHLGYPPLMRRLFEQDGRESETIFRAVKAQGATTSLDMALPDPASPAGRADWKTILARVLPHVDIAPFSAEEAMFMLDRARFDALQQTAAGRDPLEAYQPDDFLGIGRELLRLGARMALLKCGVRGMILLTGGKSAIQAIGRGAPADPSAWADRILWHEIFEVDKVVAAVGSGDNAIAGFLAALLRGADPETALATACCVGAQNVRVPDSISGVKTWDETQAMIRAGARRREVPGAGWHFLPERLIWAGPGDPAQKGAR
jgi:sugar/nucleoside kinase (ribokinase family)